jgi:hypothetical protein
MFQSKLPQFEVWENFEFLRYLEEGEKSFGGVE